MREEARTIDPGHPRYRDGERAAHVLLDLAVLDELPGIGSLLDFLDALNMRASLALAKGDEDTYLKARGMADTLRERYEDWGC